MSRSEEATVGLTLETATADLEDEWVAEDVCGLRKRELAGEDDIKLFQQYTRLGRRVCQHSPY